jgi:hypothetical protein
MLLKPSQLRTQSRATTAALVTPATAGVVRDTLA